MDKGIKLPVNEGPTPDNPAYFRRLDKNSMPELGSLNREDFIHLGDWYQAKMVDGTGFAYRIGVKEGVRDSEGDPATAMIMFWLPFAKGREPDNITIGKLEIMARAVVEATVIQASRVYDNLVGTLTSPPSYMLDDLKRDLPYAHIESPGSG